MPVFAFLALVLSVSVLRAEPMASTAPVSAPNLATLSILHPLEGARVPNLSQIWVYGAVTPGSTLTINGNQISVHPAGGYLTTVPIQAGDMVLAAEAKTPAGDSVTLQRRFSVAPPFTVLPETPSVLVKESLRPSENQLLTTGDSVRVSFQGSPGGTAEFSIEGIAKKLPMVESGTYLSRAVPQPSSMTARGVYEGMYYVQAGDAAEDADIEVVFKKGRDTIKEKAPGKITIDPGMHPRAGVITEDTVAARTGPEGGYDLFVYKGMRVRLTGRAGGHWRARFSTIQSGWIREGAVQELPAGIPPPTSLLTNMTLTHEDENTLVRIPLSDVLPYRTEQALDPAQLTITLYGALSKTDLIKYDMLDPLIRQVRWKQVAPDTVQIIIEPTFKKWWGYDVRYDGSTLIVEVRPEWTKQDIKGMVIAVDPGHGGSDTGAMGPHQRLEKEANLQIARVVKDALEKAGAKPFLTREKDIDVPLYERPRIAWNRNARLFVSVHCNSAGPHENPLWNNGYSLYWYQPQSLALARALHAGYTKHISLPDHGLYYADLAVCRMTQMPAVLTEQAYIIVPEQELLLFDSKFQRSLANAIVQGIRAFVAEK
jgi:N-acetylmuramoyl-L-alanine amidase